VVASTVAGLGVNTNMDWSEGGHLYSYITIMEY
jgi:hypothetical protein